MVRTAALGRIDYSKADSNDSIWLQRERIMLLETEREAILQQQISRHAQMANTTTWPSADTKGEIYKHHFSESRALLTSIETLLLPYDKLDKKEYYKREMEQMRAEYVAAFGDPSSPEAKEQARKNSIELAKQRATARQKMAADIEAKKQQAEKLAALRAKRSRRGRRERI